MWLQDLEDPLQHAHLLIRMQAIHHQLIALAHRHNETEVEIARSRAKAGQARTEQLQSCFGYQARANEMLQMKTKRITLVLYGGVGGEHCRDTIDGRGE
jgi:hypothetical protein